MIDQYVKTGRVSFEFRNYVLNPYDMAASVMARCAGPSGFFGLTRQLYADQPEWIAKAQGADPATLQALSTMAPNQQLVEVAKLAGFPEYAAMRGIPSAKLNACLADPARTNCRADRRERRSNLTGTHRRDQRPDDRNQAGATRGARSSPRHTAIGDKVLKTGGQIGGQKLSRMAELDEPGLTGWSDRTVAASPPLEAIRG